MPCQLFHSMQRAPLFTKNVTSDVNCIVFSTYKHLCFHRRRNDFQSGGGPDFWKSKMVRQRRPSRLRNAGGCLRSWSFFENVSSNEAIWCTIFHHLKHLTACLLRCFFFYFRTGWSKKWRGHAPPVWKMEGSLAPLAPPPPVPPPMYVSHKYSYRMIYTETILMEKNIILHKNFSLFLTKN